MSPSCISPGPSPSKAAATSWKPWAHLPDQATLFLDKSYDLTSETSRGAIGEPNKVTRQGYCLERHLH